MTELQRFRPRLARRHFTPFNFERASIQLLSSLRNRRHSVTPLPLHSEWRDTLKWNWKGARA